MHALGCANSAFDFIVLVGAEVAVHSSAIIGLIACFRFRLRVWHGRTLCLVHLKDKLAILNISVISYKLGAIAIEGDLVAGDPPIRVKSVEIVLEAQGEVTSAHVVVPGLHVIVLGVHWQLALVEVLSIPVWCPE